MLIARARRENGRTDGLGLDLVKVISLVEIDHPVRLGFLCEPPDFPADQGRGLVLGISSGEVAVQVGMFPGQLRQVACSGPESGLVGSRQHHEATLENGPMANLFRGQGPGRFVPVQAASQKNSRAGLGALDDIIGGFPFCSLGEEARYESSSGAARKQQEQGSGQELLKSGHSLPHHRRASLSSPRPLLLVAEDSITRHRRHT